MPYSFIVNGKVLDYRFRQMETRQGYNFYVGDIFMGQIFNLNNKWSAVSFVTPCVYGGVDGFKTRMDAAEFILKVYKHKG